MDQAWFRDGHRFVMTGYRATSAMGADVQYSRGELAWNEAASFGGHTFQGFLYVVDFAPAFRLTILPPRRPFS